MITGLKHRFERIRSRPRRLRLLAAANDYMGKTPGLKDILAYANVASPSVGVSTTDYVALYRKIRTDRPSFVLECGTGRSTMIIAQAMLENLNGTPADGIKLVSMEQIRSGMSMRCRRCPTSSSHSSRYGNHQSKRTLTRSCGGTFTRRCPIIHTSSCSWTGLPRAWMAKP